MDAQLQRRVQRYGWDRAADSYERSWAAQLRPAQESLLAMAALAPGERVLDVACGTGLLTFAAAAAVGRDGSVLATDISERMVEHAAREAARRGFAQVTARRMGAEALALGSESFDAVLCGLGLMYVPDVAAALAEMYRVLDTRGRVAVAVWGARSRCGWADIFPIIEARVASDVCPLFFQLGTGDTLAQALTGAGFSGVRVERIATILHYADGDEAADAAFVGGPVALAYSRFDEATRRAARAEYLASIAGFRDGARYAVPGEFVVACGRVDRLRTRRTPAIF
jgi:ubiquinone/menaquinone biosynthesis C-methylase UbiE